MAHKIVLKNGIRIFVSGGITKDNLIGLAILIQNGWTVQVATENHLLMSGSQLTIKCRASKGYDLWHLSEIFVAKEYYGCLSDRTVLDVGMSNGDSSIFFASQGCKLVIGLEPLAESFELAKYNIEINNLQEKIIPLMEALASSEKQALFSDQENLPNTAHVLDTGSRELYGSNTFVQTTCIESVCRKFNLAQIDVLKMDCEGCEYDVIMNTPSIINLVNEIILEFHGRAGPLKQMLEKNGFIVIADESKTSGYLKAKRKASQ
jgi:FkbM family methyltransferase